MHCRRLDPRVLVIVLLGLAATPALAGDAEDRFADAKKLIADGKTAEACDQFAESVTLFEAKGVAKLTAAAMINHADCREQNMQLVTAWALFLDTAKLAQNAGLRTVATEARKRAGLLQPRLSYLTILVADENRVEGLVITRDGVEIESAMWNQNVPLDGGTYVVTATAPGNSEWSSSVELAAEGAKITVEIPKLKRLEDFVAKERDTEEDVGPTVIEDRVDEPANGGFTALHWAGIGTGALGLVAIAGGVYFGLQAAAIEKEAADWDVFDADRFAEGEAAERTSIIALGAGGACVIGGAVLFYLGHRSNQPHERDVAVAPTATRNGFGLAAVGRF